MKITMTRRMNSSTEPSYSWGISNVQKQKPFSEGPKSLYFQINIKQKFLQTRTLIIASSVDKMAVAINRNILCYFKILLLTRTMDFPILIQSTRKFLSKFPHLRLILAVFFICARLPLLSRLHITRHRE